MNVYDFDKTIFDGDSTLMFYFFCLKRNPLIVRFIPKQCCFCVKYLLKLSTKTQFKAGFYSFLRGVANIDVTIEEFWEKYDCKIKSWYLKQKSNDDIIISASPEFLLKPICDKLQVKLIASRVDKITGFYTGENCYGEEKVNRFYEFENSSTIDKFYSDSKSDLPLARLSEQAFFVKGDNVYKWNTEQKQEDRIT